MCLVAAVRAWSAAKKRKVTPPTVEHFEYLLDWLESLGWTDYDRPHDYKNITAVMPDLTNWEIITMQKMSREFYHNLVNPGDYNPMMTADEIAADKDARARRAVGFGHG